MRRLAKRMAAIAAAVDPPPCARVLAFAQAVVAFGGHAHADEAATNLARWLETGGWRREG